MLPVSVHAPPTKKIQAGRYVDSSVYSEQFIKPLEEVTEMEDKENISQKRVATICNLITTFLTETAEHREPNKNRIQNSSSDGRR